MIAVLADSVAPRSGGIWKQFYIGLVLCKLSCNNEKCIAIFRTLFLFLFNTGFVLMLMNCADLFYIMCPSGMQERTALC